MRPADWAPLADSDPVPGDPVTIRELANHLLGVAENIRNQTGRMAELDAGQIWDSEAAVTFTEMQEALPPDLELAATRYENVANALFTYEGRLSSAQADADGALSRAQEAQADLDTADAGIADMEDWDTEARRIADDTNTANPDAPPVEPEPWSGTDYHALREDANERLGQARTDLDTAVGDRDDAAGEAEEAIDNASHDDLENPGFWESVLLVAADVLSIAGAVLGILSIIFPVLAPFALIVGVASLLLNSGLAMAGSKDWTDAMWDAIGLATFGVGRAFNLGSRVVRSRGALQAMNNASGRAFSLTMQRAGQVTARDGLRGARGLRATSASGRPLYGAAARSRLIRQADDAIAETDRLRRIQHSRQAIARDRYNAIRYPESPAWSGWSNAPSYMGQNIRNTFVPSGGPLGVTGQVFDLGSTFGVGGWQVYGATNNIGDARHWEWAR